MYHLILWFRFFNVAIYLLNSFMVFFMVFLMVFRFVEIAMEAMDILLQACHAQTTLNLFVESFLRMVQKLLEDSNPNLQILATNSVSFKI